MKRNQLLLLGAAGLGLYLLSKGGTAGPGGISTGTDGGPCVWVAPTNELVQGVIVGGGGYCRVNVAGRAPGSIPGPGGTQDIPMQPGRFNGPRPGTV